MLQAVWQDFLTIARDEVGSRVVETWFKAALLYRWDPSGQTAYVQVPNEFVKDWVSVHYRQLFEKHFARLLSVAQIHIQFFVGEVVADQDVTIVDQRSKKEVHNKKTIVPSLVPVQKEKEQVGGLVRQQRRNVINPNYCFANFIVGPNNSLAHAAAYAVTEQPGRLYNPLFIYGHSGLGKTHLLHAIGNQLLRENAMLSIVYQTADRFVNEFITAIRFNRMFDFREKYRTVDVLLIDDIQFIANKDQTQEAFFHIFNTLYDASKQLVFTSDVYPQHMNGVADRLKSRLACGLVTDMYAPTVETKIAILKKKAEQSGEQLPDDVADFIARSIDSNIRQLEGALVRVVAFANLTDQQVTYELACRVLQRQDAGQPGEAFSREERVDLREIAKIICSSFSLSLEELRSRRRDKKVVFARQVAMYLMKKMTGNSLRDIGSFLHRKDHSTVVHAINKVSALVVKDKEVEEHITLLRREVTTGKAGRSFV